MSIVHSRCTLNEIQIFLNHMLKFMEPNKYSSMGAPLLNRIPKNDALIKTQLITIKYVMNCFLTLQLLNHAEPKIRIKNVLKF